MTCTHNCKHQPCPAPMACGIGGIKSPTFAKDGNFLDATDFEERKLIAAAPFPVIDESLLRRPLESRSRPDDMTYSGSFNGAGVPVLHQANSDGSDPHGTFAWIDDLAESMMMRTVFVLLCWALIVIVGMGAGYFVAKLSF